MKSKPKKKISLIKRTKNWIKLTWLTFCTEVEDRVLMSWKRLIKFFGIILVPILYGIVCVLAFWNPIEGIGNAPMAIMNEDQKVLVAKSFESNEDQNDPKIVYKVGVVQAIGTDTTGFLNSVNTKLNLTEDSQLFQDTDGNIIIPEKASDTQLKKSNIDMTINQELTDNTKITLNTIDKNNTNQVISYSTTKNSFSIEAISLWELLKSNFLTKTDQNIVDTEYKFQTPVIKQGIALRNVSYIVDKKTIDNEWKKTKYYVQIGIPKNYTTRIITYIGNMLANPDNESIWDLTSEIANHKVNIWTTFERNFIFGYYMNTLSGMMDALILKALPGITSDALQELLFNDFFHQGSAIKTLLDPSDPNVSLLNDNEKYAVTKYTDLIASTGNEDLLKNVSFFGDLENPNATTPSQIGGMLINFMLNLKNLLFNNELLDNLKTLLETLNPTGPAAIIINEIIKILEEGNNLNDQFIIDVNQTIYNLSVGEPPVDSTANVVIVINDIWKKLTGSPLLDVDNFTFVKLFEPDEKVIKHDKFTQNLNKLLTANPDVFLNTTNINDLILNIENYLFLSKTKGMETNKLYNIEIQGQQFSQYGMGLGEFFLIIGLFIGALMQTFIFDRGKRTAKAKWSNYYVAKWLLLISVGSIQVTLQVWTAYLVGWSQIGAVGMTYVWLWLWFADIIFITLIQGLWFSLKDESVGKFLVVIVMVMSLAAGGGTFPPISQFPFFTAISYVVPFTYVLKGLGEIVYGVSIFGTQGFTTAYIMTQFGILWIYFFLFFSLGFWVGAPNRVKEMNYGSHYGKHVAGALKALKRDTKEFELKVKNKKNGKIKYSYNWKALPDSYDQELYLKVREMYKFEGQFKWWARKKHDFVQKPNYSDEDIITRNE